MITKEQLDAMIEKNSKIYSGVEATDTDSALWSELNRAHKAGAQSIAPMLLKALEVIKDTIDSGYDQAGHCASELAEIESMVKGDGNE